MIRISAVADDRIATTRPADRVLIFWDRRRGAWMLRLTWFTAGVLASQETSELATHLGSDPDWTAAWNAVREHPLVSAARYEQLPDAGDGFEWAIAGCSQALHNYYVEGDEERFRSFYQSIKSCAWGLAGLCPRCGSQRYFVTDEGLL